MKLTSYGLLFMMGILSLSACTGRKISDLKSKFRMINASSNTGDINVAMDYQNMYATNIQYLNYSLFSEHISTRHVLQIKNASGSIIVDTALTMEPNKTYTGFLYDSSNQVRYKLLEEKFEAPVGSFCKLRFLNLSNNAPASDIIPGTDTLPLFTNFENGDYSDYTLFSSDSMYFNAATTGSIIPYYTQGVYVKFKPGYFYTMYLKGNVGSVLTDSLGFFVVENSGNY
ncbi:MAG: DUF4397 domain-containing protein [Bacteroidetes bacterium]|nr:DUF4397 domain-containing protein [Bacteroidota bacterium]